MFAGMIKNMHNYLQRRKNALAKARKTGDTKTAAEEAKYVAQLSSQIKVWTASDRRHLSPRKPNKKSKKSK